MKQQIFLGMQRWDEQIISHLKKFSESVHGIILGDPFCPLRMFVNGNWDIPLFAEIAKSKGFKVSLQTPVYLTQRNFSDTFYLIRSLSRRKLVDLLFIQDVGLLSKIKEFHCSVPICWSFWGRTRSDSISRDIVDFYMQLGVTYLEITKSNRIYPLQKYGLKVIYRLYSYEIATFGRICYTQYVTNTKCSDGKLCTYQHPELIAVGSELKLKAQGYTLEYVKPVSFNLPTSAPDFLTIHVENLEQLPQILNNIDGK